VRARAPGKAFLAGEYAVLDGATAVIAAIARHAVADTAGPASERPEVRAVVDALAARRGSRVIPAVDVTALQLEHRKLGLGGSAAAAVATAAAILGEVGVDLGLATARAGWLAPIVAAHRASQGGAGSGGDVAAALWGGVITFSAGPGPDELRVAAFALHPEVAIVLADAGGGARTAPLARAALQVGVPAALRDAAPALSAALASGDPRAIRLAVDLHVRGMADLGAALGQDLLPPSFRRLAALCAVRGSAAKPSGAGGGELAVAFAPGRDAAARLVQALVAAGSWAEVATIDPLGARVDREGNGGSP
jgi:phosphomevalonate kinase